MRKYTVNTVPTDLTDNPTLIAPCGINCSVCGSYLARKYDVRRAGIKMAYCTGCRPRDKLCAFLKKRCDLLLLDTVRYCYECSNFPCRELKRIDARYQKYYRTSLIDNLTVIKHHSLADLIEQENAKWECPKCGAMVCCHNGICFSCDGASLRTKQRLYRWEEGP